MSDKHSQWSEKSISKPENCYDITRQLASFTAIKFTKRYGVSESVSDKGKQWSNNKVWTTFFVNISTDKNRLSDSEQETPDI